jgi:hypothetical protein
MTDIYDLNFNFLDYQLDNFKRLLQNVSTSITFTVQSLAKSTQPF